MDSLRTTQNAENGSIFEGEIKTLHTEYAELKILMQDIHKKNKHLESIA
jgi:hypothetical protein